MKKGYVIRNLLLNSLILQLVSGCMSCVVVRIGEEAIREWMEGKEKTMKVKE